MLALVHGSFTALAVPCFATEVQVVSVRPGVSADVVIDGGAPITLRVGGAPVEGVAVVEANRAGAVLRVDGTETALPLSGRESSVAPTPSSDTVTLSADEDGHFVTHGAVNGKTVSFVVDTGATLTTFSRAEAQRVGLDYRGGAPTRTLTANGIANGWRLSLDTVTLGGTTLHDVDAMVIDNDTLPIVLLGMSFLRHFDMQRQGATLLLRRR
jgi:aspartyl protease family protein